jgi:glutamine synthetase
MNPSEAIKFVKENDAQLVDVRFTDVFGTWQHFSIPAGDLSEDVFEDGLGFDGSSIRGFQTIDQSDMLLRIDANTAFMDPFTEHETAVFIADVEDPITREPYTRDPRYITRKAEDYLKSTGIGDTANFGPEAEFFVFNRLSYSNEPDQSFYSIDSEEGHWNSGAEDALGHTIRNKGGYFPCAPADKLQDLRSEMMLTLEEVGVKTELHHHEVATAGQCEIDVRYDSLLRMADKQMKFKYIIKNTAAKWGLAATFMPKPLFGDNGSGMHVHQSIWKNGTNVFYDEAGYGGLSDEARWYIGGILKHAPSLLAFTNPSTNSYRRLVPGYEAPINLIYSLRNRSACVRVPMYSMSPGAKRIEFRCPDPSANPYLAFPAMLMAGLDGIQNRIEPAEPIDKDLYDLPPEEKAGIPQTPGHLREVLLRLRDDHDYLTKGDVFTEDLIEAYIDYKLEAECDQIDLRPHPYEFELYHDI